MQVKTKNLLFGALVVVLVGLLWWRVVYSPMTSKASKDKTAAHDADASSANLRQVISGSTSSKKNKAPDVSTKAMLAALPINTAEASFLRSLDELRIASGAGFQSVTPSTPTVASGVTSATVAITAQGTEDQITHYIGGLSALPRIFIVDNMTVTKSGSTAAAGSAPLTGRAGAVFFGDQLSVSITGRIFSQQPTASATTGASGSATTPATGAPAPTGSGAPAGTVNG